MYVVAGLPPATHNHAVATLKNRFPQAQVVGLPSSPQDGALYPQRLCDSISRSVTDFAVRKRKSSENKHKAPKFIMLLYVPSFDAESLLRTFDFSVFPVPLNTLQVRGVNGAMLRQSTAAVEEAIAAAVDRSGIAQASINLIQERINRMSDAEVILLPPYNFHTGEQRLSAYFLEFRSGSRAWTNRVPELQISELTNDDIDRIPAQKTRKAYVDVRQIAFLIAHPTAFHGNTWEIDDDADASVRSRLLRALYRFGGALEAGLHHDAQRRDGVRLERCVFDCDMDGRVAVTATHANIYPTDFVRAETKVKI